MPTPKERKGYSSIGAASQQTPGATPNVLKPNKPTPNFATSSPTPNIFSQGYGQSSNFYQVTPEDKNLSDIAAKFGIETQSLVDTNKSKTLPPEGSYIQLGTQQFPGSNIPGLGVGGPAGGTTPKYPWEGRGDPSAQRLRDQATQITTQLANGQLPNSIPSATVGFMRDKNGQRITIQDLIAEGYTMNGQGVLVRSGGGGGVQTAIGTGSAEFMNTGFMQKNIANNTPFMQQLRWDSKKKKFVKIGDLVRQGRLDLKTGRSYDQPMKRNKKGKLVAADKPAAEVVAPVEPQVTRESASTVLDIHLGSG